MKPDLYGILRSNRREVYKADTDGEQMLALIEGSEVKSQAEGKALMAKHDGICNWARSVIGVTLKHVPRTMVSFRDSAWRRCIKQYMKTAYGRAFYNYTLRKAIINAKLDIIRASEFEQFHDFKTVIFGENCPIV
ncbi:hypothetical protein DTO166G4_5462 [Paecilomyces variotii]|nr:hypothetical protein DTO166G4_5462 [Paecilomyces variotii]KAJ9223837.1 hypothetical protein DTO169C6_3707 [Paecilomyces variotii]KAJ9236123.1 hypothetical protein DTO166G5_4168 [Paecilomyces variotii]KAJ9254763.1 hypothetical protein DTO195F2_6519 [Paecilomyces variotii]KAJ9286465.1 hypothetical protein DTO021C3_5999 [Paecilomyces variotii]